MYKLVRERRAVICTSQREREEGGDMYKSERERTVTVRHSVAQCGTPIVPVMNSAEPLETAQLVVP